MSTFYQDLLCSCSLCLSLMVHLYSVLKVGSEKVFSILVALLGVGGLCFMLLVFSNRRIKISSGYMQGIMEHHKEIVDYFNRRSVSVIFLFRRNLLRRMVSVLANSYDRYAKLLNGTHKSHVHTSEEVCLCLSQLSLISLMHEMEITIANFF